MEPKVWMFHYVRPQMKDLPNLISFPLEKFEKFLDNNIETLRKYQAAFLLDLLINNIKLPDDSILLTFDDGLFDHYEWVFPALKSRGVTGIFFVSTLPFVKNEILAIHKIHLLYGTYGYKWLKNKAILFSDNNSEYKKYFENDPRALNAYPFDSAEIAYFKYSLNYLLPQDYKQYLIDDIFSNTNDNIHFYKNMYLTRNQVKEMENAGMVFGYHGHSHLAFSNLSSEDFSNEIKVSISILEEIIGDKLYCMSYPFGDITSYNSMNIQKLNEFGIKIAFTSEIENNGDLLQYPRTDCAVLYRDLL
jgi:peptidoglycan/xylan/chitin deacetylase (PgdA/CDA1 family)